MDNFIINKNEICIYAIAEAFWDLFEIKHILQKKKGLPMPL